MTNYRLDLSYDGSGFHGFARQPGQRTVQGELEGALWSVTHERIETTGAGRTDRGVHARQQVVSFRSEHAYDLARLTKSLNGVIGPEVAIWSARRVPEGWSARFSAEWRSYRYFIDNRPAPDPLERHRTWHVRHRLDLGAMNEAAACFLGEHDFTSFCREVPGRSNVRRIIESTWSTSDLCEYYVKATSFCHQQVRSLVGLCVDVGRGKIDPEQVPAIIAGQDRSRVGSIAPPHGLVLWEVGFPELDG